MDGAAGGTEIEKMNHKKLYAESRRFYLYRRYRLKFDR